MPGSFFPRLRVLQHLRIELAVAVHRFLEDLDSARQLADLVGAPSVGNLDMVGAVRDLFDGCGDHRQRTGDRAGDDEHADHDHAEREPSEAGQQKGQLVAGVGLQRQPPAAFGINLRQRVEILVEGGTHFTVGVVVAPFAPRGRTDLDAAANQLLAKLDKLIDPFLEDRELLGIIGLDERLPVLDHRQKLVVELEQPVAVPLHGGEVRHVDAAGFHHHRVDQRIDVLNVECGTAGGLDGFRELGIPAGIVVG
jgi:hypothetical protein